MDFLVSITPILSLFALMLIFRMSGWKSAVITLAITVGLMLLLSHRLGIVPSKYADAPILFLAADGVLEG